MHPIRFAAAVLIALTLAPRPAVARDLAGIPWKDFARRSELVFSGQLTRAEILDDTRGRDSTIRYTYKVYTTFKGEELKHVTFDAPAMENVNKEIGRLAIVALRKDGERWALSVDERSCWRHENRMTRDFHGYAVYDVPATLLHDLPAAFAENVQLLVRHGDEQRPEIVKVFPTAAVEAAIRAALRE